MKTYLFSYRFDGDEYGFDIVADSRDEAMARLAMIKAWAKYDGELIAAVPASLGWLAKAIVFGRNFLFGPA